MNKVEREREYGNGMNDTLKKKGDGFVGKKINRRSA